MSLKWETMRLVFALIWEPRQIVPSISVLYSAEYLSWGGGDELLRLEPIDLH